MNEIESRYPREITVGETTITLEMLDDPASDDVAEFASGLPNHDLLFLSRDIQEPKVLSAWRSSIEAGDIVSIVARKDGEVLGTTAIVTDKHSWSSHVGELRVLVSPAARSTGLGRHLIQESFLIGLELGLEKLTVRMTLDQEGAMAVFEELGFRREAMFKDHVKDASGRKHDLLIMSHDVEGFLSQKQAYGLDRLSD